MFGLKKYGINLKKQNIELVNNFLIENFGEPVDFTEVDIYGFPIRIFYFKTKNSDNIIATMGLHAIELPSNPENVFGIELFARMPQDWKFDKDENFGNGWINIAIASIGTSMRKKEAMVPGSTYEFPHLANETKHNAMVVNFTHLSDNMFVPVNKKQAVLYFELQSVLPDELQELRKGNECVLEKIYCLNCIDLQRKSAL